MTNLLGSLFILFILIVIAILIKYLRLSKRMARLRGIVKDYRLEAETLARHRESKWTDQDRTEILNFKDWDDWKARKRRLQDIISLYPEAVAVYIRDYFPSVKDAPLYDTYDYKNTAVQNCRILVDCLQYDDLLRLMQLTAEDWEHRSKIHKEARFIAICYPDAVSQLRKAKQVQTDDDIVHERRQLATIQRRFNVASAYKSWMERQEKFCSTVRNNVDEYAPSCGCYWYMVDFEQPLENGRTKTAQFKLWQIFRWSMSPYYLEYQTPGRQRLYNKLPAIKAKSISFNPNLYDGIKAYFEEMEPDNKIVILFNNRTSYGWDKDTYDFYYSKLLVDFDCTWLDVENLHEHAHSLDCNIIFVMDFITTNPDMRHTAKMIIESFSTKIPTLVWFSIIKEYDEEESRELWAH